MRLFKKFFTQKDRPFLLRYSKTFDEWQVYEESRIVYQGTKARCNQYIKFMTSK